MVDRRGMVQKQELTKTCLLKVETGHFSSFVVLFGFASSEQKHEWCPKT